MKNITIVKRHNDEIQVGIIDKSPNYQLEIYMWDK